MGAVVSLHSFRSPVVPPAGALVNVTIVSFAAVEPGWTKTTPVRFGKSVRISRLLGRVEMFVTSVGGLLGSSTMRFAPEFAVMAPVQRPPLTLKGVPPFNENMKVRPVMPLADDLQISSLPVSPPGQRVVLSARTPSTS